MNKTFDEQMQNIGRREYGLHPALAGPFRKENGSIGIHVSASGRQSRTAVHWKSKALRTTR